MLNGQQRQDLQGIASMGRNEDTFLAHVAPDEMVVPAQVLRDDPFLNALIRKSISKYGVDPNQFVVGNGDMDLNPLTGLPEFGFLSKVWKKVKKVVKKAAPVLGVAATFIPGVGPALGSALGGLGGAATSVLSKIPGIGGALSSGASALGSALTGGIGSLGKIIGKVPGLGTLGQNLQDFGLYTGTPLSQGLGALGQGIGGLFQQPQQGGMGGMMPGGGFYQVPGGGMMYPQQMGGFINVAGQQQPGFLSRLGGGISDFLGSIASPFYKDGQLTGLGAGGLGALLGKVTYEDVKSRMGGLAETPAVTMDPLGRYQLSKALGTGGTRAEFGLGPAPQTLKFAKGGAVMIEELDMRDGGESAGPGTGTSDDIPAMLSDGEYVMTAKSVRGAGSFSTKKTPQGIELIGGGKSSREQGVKNMRELMNIFEAV